MVRSSLRTTLAAALLFLGVAAAACASADPPAAAGGEALWLYENMVRAYSEADGIELDGSLRSTWRDADGHEHVMLEGEWVVRFARPLHGRSRFDGLGAALQRDAAGGAEREALSFGTCAEGETLYALDWVEQRAEPLGPSAEAMPGADFFEPLAIWAGREPDPFLGLELLDTDPARKGLRGIRVTHADWTNEFWLEPDGRVREWRQEFPDPLAFGEASWCTFWEGRFTTVQLHEQADPQAFATAIPAAFAPAVDAAGLARAQLQVIEVAAARFMRANRRPPDSLDELTEPDSKTGLPWIVRIPADPWGFPYMLVTGPDGTLYIASYGRDHAPGGEGEDADLRSRDL